MRFSPTLRRVEFFFLFFQKEKNHSLMRQAMKTSSSCEETTENKRNAWKCEHIFLQQDTLQMHFTNAYVFLEILFLILL